MALDRIVRLRRSDGRGAPGRRPSAYGGLSLGRRGGRVEFVTDGDMLGGLSRSEVRDHNDDSCGYQAEYA